MSSHVDPNQDPSLVASLNNTAAQEMLNGNYGKAVRMLSAALKQTSSLLRSPRCQDVSFEADTHRQPQGGAFSSFMSPAEGTCPRKTEDKHEYFTFQCPLQIDYPEAACPNNARSMAETYSHSIVYNLALCHHLVAMTMTEACKRQHHLRRAVALYEQAKRLLPRHREPIHKVAVFNNLGHAHHILGNTEISKRYFRQVLILITPMTTPGRQQESSSSSSRIQMDGFLRNAFHVVSGSGATVAAAA